MFKSYRKKHWDRKRYCERYGHTMKEEHIAGLHIGKQMMVSRYVKSCTHCGKVFKRKDIPIDEKPQNYGISFDSEGVCSHCINYNDCRTAPKSGTDPYGRTYYPTFVYGYCPINNFKGDESFYKRIKGSETIFVR